MNINKDKYFSEINSKVFDEEKFEKALISFRSDINEYGNAKQVIENPKEYHERLVSEANAYCKGVEDTLKFLYSAQFRKSKNYK